MDREILFRGRTIKTRFGGDKWIEGFFVMSCAGRAEMEPAIITGTEKGCFMTEFVDPATVGQYTGLCDKDGKKIFEGDILYKEGHWTFYVGYEMGAFRAIPLEPVQKLNWPHCTLEEFLRVGMGDCKGFKVIGNIHDNPELLEEAK